MSASDPKPLAYLTVLAVSRELQVSEKTVRRWLKEGTIKGHRLNGRGGWRINRSEIAKALGSPST